MPHAEDGSIHWEEEGEGPPLLLVMAYGLGGDAWAPLRPHLGGHRLVRFDHRGTGRSGLLTDDLSIDTMTEDALAVLDAAGIERTHVFGISMGGMVAQALALDHPERVAGLVLGCTSAAPVRFVGAGEAVVELIQGITLLPTDLESGLDIVLPLVFSDRFLREDPSIRELARTLAGSITDETAAAIMQSLSQLAVGDVFDVTERLGEIQVPTLVQHGDADRLIPVAAARELADRIPGAEYQELTGAGHGYVMERPEDAIPRLLSVIRDGTRR
ncbi:MAG: Alpha/beta hydrolase fold protein [Chloroflexi bacterium]|nr:Alpha/beta hydrolase fold protein [Chloroflexota bacterium]